MIFLNNGATSHPKPPLVLSLVTQCIQELPWSFGNHETMSTMRNYYAECRLRLANFIGADSPDDLILTSGATEALNTVFRGLEYEEAHIVTTVTEHNALYRPLNRAVHEKGYKVDFVGCDRYGVVDPDDIAKSVTNRTKLVAVNHMSNVTGAKQDIDSISRICRERGILLLVDAAQTLGMITVDVVKTCIDLLVVSGHKGLWGLPGIGALYVDPGVELAPLNVGPGSRGAELTRQPTERPALYEAGTPNIPGCASLIAGISHVESIGGEIIFEHKHKLCCKMLAEIRQLPGITIYHAPDDDGVLFSFRIEGIAPATVESFMLSRGILVRSGLSAAPMLHQALGTYPEGSVRISPGFETTEEEIETFIGVLAEYLRKGR